MRNISERKMPPELQRRILDRIWERASAHKNTNETSKQASRQAGTQPTRLIGNVIVRMIFVMKPQFVIHVYKIISVQD